MNTEEQTYFTLHRDGEDYSAELTMSFPTTVTVEQFLVYVADFMRASGYQIPSCSLEVVEENSLR